MEREKERIRELDARKKELLDLFIRDVEEEVFAQFDRELDERLAGEIRGRIRERVQGELQRDSDRLLERFKRSVTREIVSRVVREEKLRKKKELEGEQFQRFNVQFRIQHVMMFTSVIILILTGLPLKFPNVDPLAWLIYLMGGIENSRILHRIGASLLIFVAIYHTAYTVIHRDGRRDFLLLLPRPKDVLDALTNVKYFLGLSGTRPRFGRFSYVEKFDYWAVYWGCVVMIGSGALMWFENTSLRFLPKFILDIAKEAHSDEALLATLAIVIWHFYNVHFNPDSFPMSWTWWTGKITREEMEENHPLEYKEILRVRGETEDTPDLGGIGPEPVADPAAPQGEAERK